MLAKKSDGTLATIQMKDKNTGFQVYAPIQLDAYNYKKFYFETLAYSVIAYIMFFKDIKFKIVSGDEARSGELTITEQSLPHLLGIEPKFVSSKDSAIMERIMPGFNRLDIIDKIMCIVENNERIIQYETDNGIDLFNYYKCMQKNKEFLMLGRFFNKDEENTEDKNKVFLISNSDNQLCLYKKSNMNITMNRNICKIIVQQLENGDYFPRSLQMVSNTMAESLNILDFLGNGKYNITLDGQQCEMSCSSDESGFTISVVNGDEMRGYSYLNMFYANPNNFEEIELVKTLIRDLGGDETIVTDVYLDEMKTGKSR